MRNDDLPSIDLRIKFLSILTVIFPGEKFLLENFSEEVGAFLEEAGKRPGFLGVLTINPYTDCSLYTGTLVSIEGKKGRQVILKAGKRFFVEKIVIIGGISVLGAQVKIAQEENKNLKEFFTENNWSEQDFLKVVEIMRESKKFLFPEKRLREFTVGELADYLASFLPKTSFFERWDVFETTSEIMRLEKAFAYVHSYFANSAMEKASKSSGQNSGSRGKRSDAQEFQKRLDKIKGFINEEVGKEIQKEIKSLEKTPPSAGDYDYISKWLEFVLSFFP